MLPQNQGEDKAPETIYLESTASPGIADCGWLWAFAFYCVVVKTKITSGNGIQAFNKITDFPENKCPKKVPLGSAWLLHTPPPQASVPHHHPDPTARHLEEVVDGGLDALEDDGGLRQERRVEHAVGLLQVRGEAGAFWDTEGVSSNPTAGAFWREEGRFLGRRARSHTNKSRNGGTDWRDRVFNHKLETRRLVMWLAQPGGFQPPPPLHCFVPIRKEAGHVTAS